MELYIITFVTCLGVIGKNENLCKGKIAYVSLEPMPSYNEPFQQLKLSLQLSSTINMFHHVNKKM